MTVHIQKGRINNGKNLFAGNGRRCASGTEGEAVIPNPVTLVAYRTFSQVEQPESLYIFRMQDRNGIQCALYEADGGAWKIDAMRRIKAYLEAALEGMDGYIVIS